MKEQLQKAEMEKAEALAADYNRQAEAMMAAALKNVAEQYDPSIRTMQDIAAMPTAKRFYELMQRGNSIEDAFYLANRDAIDKRRAAAAYRKGAEAGGSRQHLSPQKTAQGKQVEVPADVARSYREVMPGITDAEIAAEYAAYMKTFE